MAHSFSSEERQNIRWALRSNPAILEHVSSLSEINSLTKNRLVDIMNALGIDIEEAKSGRYTEKMLGEPENGIHSDEYYAFSGYLDVAATLSINGEEIPGVVITEYDYTPEWPFFDKTVGRVRNMHGMGSYKFHFVDAEHYPMEQVSTKGRRLITPPDLTNAVDITSLVAENSLSIDDDMDDLVDEESMRENAKNLRLAKWEQELEAKGDIERFINSIDVTQAVDNMLRMTGRKSVLEENEHGWNWTAVEIEDHTNSIDIGFSQQREQQAAKVDIAWRFMIIYSQKAEVDINLLYSTADPSVH